MAKHKNPVAGPAPAPAAAPVAAARRYAVTVKRRAEVKTSHFVPGRRYTVSAEVHAALGDAIATGKPVG